MQQYIAKIEKHLNSLCFLEKDGLLILLFY